MTSIADIFVLNDGTPMPIYGFGCYKIQEPEPCIDAVLAALDCGYRYIDTAAFYKNEDAVGEAVRRGSLPRNSASCSPVPRESLFIVSKIWPTAFQNPVEALHESLRLLRLDYLDGFLLHWPGTDAALRLKAFEALLKEREAGRIRSLGVSNFLEPHLLELHAQFGLWPSMNQIEVHPAFTQSDLCAFCAERGIRVVAWAPLGRGTMLTHPLVLELAAATGKTPAQVVLRWHLQRNRLPIPKSATPERIRENAAVFDFTLTSEQLARLDACNLPGIAGRTSKDPMTFAG